MAGLGWRQSFKPEIQKNGADYLAAGEVVLTVTSDTAINGFVKGSSASRVSLISTGIESDTFFADCSCSSSLKGQFCKHMWAVLLLTEKKHPDFLDSKKIIEKSEKNAQAKSESPFKIKQDEYKKQQYEKQKVRAKEMRQARKSESRAGSKSKLNVPADLAEALEYFKSNGFPFEQPLNPESLREAKKSLSRIFHPDKGGTNQEAADLNHNFEVLMSYAR